MLYGNNANRTFTFKGTKNPLQTSSLVYLPNNNKFLFFYTYIKDKSYYSNLTELCLNEKALYDCSQKLENNTPFNNSEKISILSNDSISDTSNSLEDLNTITSDIINGNSENINYIDSSEIISNNAILNYMTIV
jgi:hypothetical protein